MRGIASQGWMLYNTDKSGKLAVTTLENYKKQGDEHTKGDKVVDWKQVKEIQNKVKAHLRALNRIFNTGANHHKKSKERTWRAKEAMATMTS